MKFPSLKWFFISIIFISVGYHHKLIICGLIGEVFGFHWICHTVIHGITTNYWFEHFVFVPLIWVAFNHIKNIVFSSKSLDISDDSWKKRKWFGQFLAMFYIYGHGMHITNTVEVYSRMEGLANGPLYDQIYWIDEHLSHTVQFIPYFIMMSWFLIHDKLDRNVGKNVAIVSGVLHGVDRGYGITEGNSPSLGVFLMGLVVLAVGYRYYRHGSSFQRAFQDFFFRYGFGLVVTNFIFMILYQILFGVQTQLSDYAGAGAWVIVATALSCVFGMLLLFFGMDRFYKNQLTIKTKK